MRDISYIEQKIYKNISLSTKKRAEAVVAASKTEVQGTYDIAGRPKRAYRIRNRIRR